METAEHSSETKKYSKYTREMRLELIRMVDEERVSTAQAARTLGIKQTSACRIMRSFHHHHRIFEKKTDRLLRQRQEAQTHQQKDSPVSNKTQQNIALPQKQSAAGQQPLLPALNTLPFEQEQHQNAERREGNVGGQGVSLLLPLFNFPPECFPFYYSGVSPLGFGYFV